MCRCICKCICRNLHIRLHYYLRIQLIVHGEINYLKGGNILSAINTINAYRIQADLDEVDTIYSDVGPLDTGIKKYCSQVTKEFNWGLWYDPIKY